MGLLFRLFIQVATVLTFPMCTESTIPNLNIIQEDRVGNFRWYLLSIVVPYRLPPFTDLYGVFRGLSFKCGDVGNLCKMCFVIFTKLFMCRITSIVMFLTSLLDFTKIALPELLRHVIRGWFNSVTTRIIHCVILTFVCKVYTWS